jgi:type VI secretion system protein
MLVLTVAEGRIAVPSEGSRVLYRTNVTIGRHEINDWVLPDPDRYLSGRHCVITYRDGEYWITDTSTNGVFVNGAPNAVGRGSSLPLRDGDSFKIGDYEIRVKVAPDLDQPARAPTGRAAPQRDAADPFAQVLAADAPSVNDADPFGLGHGPAGSLSGEFGGAPSSASSDPVPRSIAPGTLGTPSRAPETGLEGIGSPRAISLDDDPLFAPVRPGNEAWDRRLPDARFAADPGSLGFHDDDSSPSTGPLSPDPIGPGLATPYPAAYPDHLPAPNQALPPPRPLWGSSPNTRQRGEPEPAALPGEPMPRLPDPPPVELGSPPRIKANPPPLWSALETPVDREPPEAAPSAPSAQIQASKPPDRDAADSSLTASAAFLKAAGIEIGSLPDADAIELMRTAGACFREMTDGLRQVLAARSTLKNELRLDRTVIGAANNNPVKFSTGLEDTLVALLRPPARGYMPGAEALREAFHDLKAHELATMSGVQAALRAVLRRFDPTNLKQRLDQHPTLASILPGARQSRYWAAYEQLYREVASDAENSFDGLYGREFVRAYEAQVKKLE